MCAQMIFLHGIDFSQKRSFRFDTERIRPKYRSSGISVPYRETGISIFRVQRVNIKIHSRCALYNDENKPIKILQKIQSQSCDNWRWISYRRKLYAISWTRTSITLFLRSAEASAQTTELPILTIGVILGDHCNRTFCNLWLYWGSHTQEV